MSDACGHAHDLVLTGVSIDYGWGPVLENVNLRLVCGRMVGLVGPNGAGKTSLLKAVAGLLRARGTIRLHGMPPGSMGRSVAYVPQREDVDWDFPVTVRGLVEMGRFGSVGTWGKWQPEDDRAVDNAIRLLGLESVAGRHIKELSGGQQQRAFVARACAQQAHVYLMDEPMSGLDAAASEELFRALHELARGGRLVVASHHDLRTVSDAFDDVVVLGEKRVIAFGPIAEAFNAVTLERAYGRQVGVGTARNGQTEENGLVR